MNNKPRTLYWDSGIFLSHLNGIPERKPIIDEVVQEIRDGKDSIVLTSSVSLVEVSSALYEKMNKLLDPAVEDAIDAMFNDSDVVRIVDNGPHIALLARNITRQAIPKGLALKPMDAIHLATARWLLENGILVQEINSYDKKWASYKEFVGIEIGPPHVLQHRLPS